MSNQTSPRKTVFAFGRGGGFEPLRPLGLDCCFVDEHDGNIVFHWVNAVAAGALKAFRALPVFERLLARRTNQDLEKVFGEHDASIVLQKRPRGAQRKGPE